MLQAGQRWARSGGTPLRFLKAHILPDNHASARAFASVGFTKQGPSDWLWEIAK
jgi:RimJ/RimL family protein N-acetyltransferase